jgi:hypothetical protein
VIHIEHVTDRVEEIGVLDASDGKRHLVIPGGPAGAGVSGASFGLQRGYQDTDTHALPHATEHKHTYVHTLAQIH